LLNSFPNMSWIGKVYAFWRGPDLELAPQKAIFLKHCSTARAWEGRKAIGHFTGSKYPEACLIGCH
jgi:hypothetical protein